MIGLDESDKFYWKHEMFLFQKQKIGRYICHSMLASQYKSKETKQIYVHIVAS